MGDVDSNLLWWTFDLFTYCTECTEHWKREGRELKINWASFQTEVQHILQFHVKLLSTWGPSWESYWTKCIHLRYKKIASAAKVYRCMMIAKNSRLKKIPLSDPRFELGTSSVRLAWWPSTPNYEPEGTNVLPCPVSISQGRSPCNISYSIASRVSI